MTAMSVETVDEQPQSRNGSAPAPPLRRPPRGLPVQPRAPKQLAPRGVRWWIGAVLMILSVLLLTFVADATTFSWLQYNRAQTLEYGELRSALAKATVPVGQLDSKRNLVPLGTPIALLRIPALGVSQVVSEGTTAKVLRSGPGHRRDSALPGQAGTAVVMGRQTSYGGPFGSISRLVPGDTITVTTGQGRSTFRVVDVRRESDPAPAPPPLGAGRLELITADGLPLFPQGGLYVDAELVSEVRTTPSSVMSYPALPAAERAMGQDHAAWVFAAFAFAVFVAVGVLLVWLWRVWGRRQAWLIGVPIMVVLAATVVDQVLDALPNLI
ncbi:MAG TPA: class E sortase [Gryllotalpicola sp.]